MEEEPRDTRAAQNILFSEETCISPDRSIAVDLLHALPGGMDSSDEDESKQKWSIEDAAAYQVANKKPVEGTITMRDAKGDAKGTGNGSFKRKLPSEPSTSSFVSRRSLSSVSGGSFLSRKGTPPSSSTTTDG